MRTRRGARAASDEARSDDAVADGQSPLHDLDDVAADDDHDDDECVDEGTATSPPPTDGPNTRARLALGCARDSLRSGSFAPSTSAHAPSTSLPQSASAPFATGAPPPATPHMSERDWDELLMAPRIPQVSSFPSGDDSPPKRTEHVFERHFPASSSGAPIGLGIEFDHQPSSSSDVFSSFSGTRVFSSDSIIDHGAGVEDEMDLNFERDEDDGRVDDWRSFDPFALPMMPSAVGAPLAVSEPLSAPLARSHGPSASPKKEVRHAPYARSKAPKLSRSLPASASPSKSLVASLAASSLGVSASARPAATPPPPLQATPRTMPSLPSPSQLPQRKGNKSHSRKRSANHVPRPRNAFILFRQHIANETPVPLAGGMHLHKNVSKLAGELWRSLAPRERKYWEDLAASERENHRRMYPGYKYAPKRSHDEQPARARSSSPQRPTAPLTIPQDPERQARESAFASMLAQAMLEGLEGDELEEFLKQHEETPKRPQLSRSTNSSPVKHTRLARRPSHSRQQSEPIVRSQASVQDIPVSPFTSDAPETFLPPPPQQLRFPSRASNFLDASLADSAPPTPSTLLYQQDQASRRSSLGRWALQRPSSAAYCARPLSRLASDSTVREEAPLESSLAMGDLTFDAHLFDHNDGDDSSSFFAQSASDFDFATGGPRSEYSWATTATSSVGPSSNDEFRHAELPLRMRKPSISSYHLGSSHLFSSPAPALFGSSSGVTSADAQLVRRDSTRSETSQPS